MPTFDCILGACFLEGNYTTRHEFIEIHSGEHCGQNGCRTKHVEVWRSFLIWLAEAK